MENYSKLFLTEHYKVTKALSDTYNHQFVQRFYISHWFQTDHSSAIVLFYIRKATFLWGLWTINIQTVRASVAVYHYEALGRRAGAQPSAYSSSHFLMRTCSYKAQAKQGLSNLVITHSSPLRCGRVIGCLQQRSKLVTPVLTVSLEHSDYAKWIDARARHLGRETEEILNAAPDAPRRWRVGSGGENARLDAQRNWLSNL